MKMILLMVLMATPVMGEVSFNTDPSGDSGPMVENATAYGISLKAYGSAGEVGKTYAQIGLCEKYVIPLGDMVPFVAAVRAYPGEFFGAMGEENTMEFITAFNTEVDLWKMDGEPMTEELKEETRRIACGIIALRSEGLLMEIK